MKVAIDINKEFYCEQQVRMALLWKDLKAVENKSITSSIKKFSTMKRSEMEILSEYFDLKYLLGVLNSKYASILLSNIRGRDYHIVPEHIRNIPIPKVTKSKQMLIINLVNKILEAKKNNLHIETLKEELEIDLLVYQFYVLTYEDVINADPKTTITREEYEQ